MGGCPTLNNAGGTCGGPPTSWGRGPSTGSKQPVPLIPSQLRPAHLDPIGQDRAGREV